MLSPSWQPWRWSDIMMMLLLLSMDDGMTVVIVITIITIVINITATNIGSICTIVVISMVR